MQSAANKSQSPSAVPDDLPKSPIRPSRKSSRIAGAVARRTLPRSSLAIDSMLPTTLEYSGKAAHADDVAASAIWPRTAPLLDSQVYVLPPRLYEEDSDEFDFRCSGPSTPHTQLQSPTSTMRSTLSTTLEALCPPSTVQRQSPYLLRTGRRHSVSAIPPYPRRKAVQMEESGPRLKTRERINGVPPREVKCDETAPPAPRPIAPPACRSNKWGTRPPPGYF